jgi:hypothetical protein
MLIRILPAALAISVLATPALAGHCPRDVKKIDAALGSSQISAADKAQVKALRDSGDQMHKSGKHGGSLKALHQAIKILGIKH